MKEIILNAIEAIKELDITNSRKSDVLIAIRLAVNESDNLTFKDMFDINCEIDWFLDSLNITDIIN